MARHTSVPSYRLHKQSGQAIVTLVDPLKKRKDILLGSYGSAESRAEYARVLAEWEANFQYFSQPQETAPALSVNELILRFWGHVENHYRHPDGSPSSEVDNYRLSLRPLRELHGHTPAREFGPLSLKAVRQRMIDTRLARRLINQRIGRIKRLFKWAVGEELVPPSVYQGLQAVSGLQQGRTAAAEPDPIGSLNSVPSGTAVSLAASVGTMAAWTNRPVPAVGNSSNVSPNSKPRSPT